LEKGYDDGEIILLILEEKVPGNQDLIIIHDAMLRLSILHRTDFLVPPPPSILDPPPHLDKREYALAIHRLPTSAW
jgi:hypothetical protein